MIREPRRAGDAPPVAVIVGGEGDAIEVPVAPERHASPRSGLSLFLVLGAVAAIAPASFDIYLPGLPAMASDLGVGAAAVQLTLTTYLIGLAVGQIVGGAISDVHGRRRPLLAGMAACTIASVVCAISPNIPTLAAMRFVQGATATFGMVIARAVVRDLYHGAAAARYLSRLMLIIGLAPILAPLIGGQVLKFGSWRGVFFVVAAMGVTALIAAARLLPETLPPERRRPSGSAEMFRVFGRLLRDRHFVGFTVIVGFGGAATVSFIAGSSFVLQEVYGASPQLYAAAFGACAIAMVAGAQINAHLLRTIPPRRMLGVGLAVLTGGAAALTGIVALDIANLGTVVLLLAVVLSSWSFVQVNAIALALTDYRDAAGSASALLGVSNYVCGAACAPLVGIGGSDTALPMAIVIVTCALIATCALRLVPREYAAPSG